MLETLRTPLGPLPIWVWIAAGALALWLFKKYRGGDGLFTSALQTTPAAGAAKNEEGLDADGNAALLDNDSWGQGAINALIAAGIDPLQAQYAIGTYLGGGEIDPSSSSLISQAIRGSGLPPEPVEMVNKPPTLPSPNQPTGTPANSTPKPKPVTSKPVEAKPSTPATKPKTTTSQFTTYKIKSGDTLSEIAKSHKTTVKELAALNKISNPNKIYAGSTIKIPK